MMYNVLLNYALQFINNNTMLWIKYKKYKYSVIRQLYQTSKQEKKQINLISNSTYYKKHTDEMK